MIEGYSALKVEKPTKVSSISFLLNDNQNKVLDDIVSNNRIVGCTFDFERGDYAEASLIALYSGVRGSVMLLPAGNKQVGYQLPNPGDFESIQANTNELEVKYKGTSLTLFIDGKNPFVRTFLSHSLRA
jgi:hypothetical protein